jgi:uncharacterized protein DUF3786
MKAAIDACHFQDLAEKDPEDVCRRALCRYDGNKGFYTLSVWGEDYCIFPEESRIMRLGDDNSNIKTFLSLFMVHYLLTAKETPISKEWISGKDIPGGSTFFRGPHEIPAYLIEKRYGDNMTGFSGACEILGGTPLDMADRAYSFRIAPRIPVAILLWKGDDEFPVKSKMLFDRSIIDHLALDIVLALAAEVIEKIAQFPIDES